MTLPVQTSKTIVACNGVLTTFNYSFWIDSQADAQLILIDNTGAETVINPANWALNINADPHTGGTFTYPETGPAITNGNNLCLARKLPLAQNTSLSNQAAYYPATVEGAFDYSMAIAQQLEEQISRTFGTPIGENPQAPIGGVNARKATVVSFDNNGNLTLEPRVDFGGGAFDVGFTILSTGTVSLTKHYDTVRIDLPGTLTNGQVVHTPIANTVVLPASGTLTSAPGLGTPRPTMVACAVVSAGTVSGAGTATVVLDVGGTPFGTITIPSATIGGGTLYAIGNWNGNAVGAISTGGVPQAINGTVTLSGTITVPGLSISVPVLVPPNS